MTKRLNTTLLAGLITAALAIPQAIAAGHGHGGHGGGGQGKGGDRLAKVFERMDSDGDGVISLVEMTAPIAAKAAHKLARKDQNDDAVLTATEFGQNRHGNAIDLSAIAAQIVQCVTDFKETSANDDIIVPTVSSFEAAQARFARLDTSGDGFIDLAELEAAMLTKASDGFAHMDRDADGALSMEEFGTAHKSRRATKRVIRQCVQEISDDAAV